MIKKIIFFPFYIISIFTQTKSFKANPVIGSVILNILGLHVIRVVLSRVVYNFKLLLLAPLIGKRDRDFFRKNGYLVKEGFLGEDDFEKVLSEAQDYNGETRLNIQGNTLVYRSFLTQDNLDGCPSINRFLDGKYLQKLLKYCSAKNEVPRFYIEKIEHGVVGNDRPDPQKNLHSDTFHPTVKAWLFLKDVEMEDGPFNYVVGSNKLTYKRLIWEYLRSIKAKNINDGYSEKGSFRASSEDLEFLGLQSPKPLTVKANTLVIANTNGFHCRGEAINGRQRLTLWFTSRCNPFNPFPGFGFRFIERFRDGMFEMYQKSLDAKASSKGGKPSWFIVEGSKYK